MNNSKRRKNKIMKQKQEQKTVQLTPEEQQGRKDIIALALVEELKQLKDSNDKTIRSIIIRRAKEYAVYCKPISKVTGELAKKLATEKLCSQRYVRRVLDCPEFEQFKDMHQSKRRSNPNKTKSGGTSSSQVSVSSSVSKTESKTSPDANTPKPSTSTSTSTKQQHSLQVLNERQAIDESNNFQSLLGQIDRILRGESTVEQTNKDTEDKGKTYERKIIEQSRDHMRMFAMRIPDGHFRSIKVQLGRLSILLETFEEIFSQEVARRERTESMAGV